MGRPAPTRAWLARPPATAHMRSGGAFFPLVIVLFVLGGAVSTLNVAAMGWTMPVATVLALLFSLVPLGLLAFFFIWLDSGEPETRGMFTIAVLWGALVATGFALVINTVSVSIFGTFVGVALVAPVVEECAKAALIFFLYWWRRAHFDGPLDGIVYAGFIGMGFAFVENISYLTAAYSGISLADSSPVTPGAGTLTATFILRGLLTPFAHPLFTAAIGFGVGMASNARSTGGKTAWALGGLSGAIILHGLWNGLNVTDPVLFVVAYFVFFFPIFVFYLWYSVRARRRVIEAMARALQDLSWRGLLHPADAQWLWSPAHRRRLRRSARTYGSGARSAMRAYQTNALHFAKLHDKWMQGMPPAHYREEGQHYLSELRALRPHLKPVPPQ